MQVATSAAAVAVAAVNATAAVNQLEFVGDHVPIAQVTTLTPTNTASKANEPNHVQYAIHHQKDF